MTDALPDSSMDERTLRHRLEDIPQNVTPHIKLGFELLAGLDDEKRRNVVNYVLENFAGKAPYRLADVAKHSGLDRKIAGDLISALSLTVGAIYDLDVTTDDFFRFVSDEIVPGNCSAAVREALEIIQDKKAELSKEVESLRLGNTVLPSFRTIEGEVDVRYDFDDLNEISGQAITAVVYINTDYKKDLFFQVDKKNLKDIIEKLKSLMVRIEVLENKKD